MRFPHFLLLPMKSPLYTPGQPVVCTDAFEAVPGVPDPQTGHLYQVAACHLHAGRWMLELREFPRAGREAFVFQEEAFAPVDAGAETAISALLAEAFAPLPACGAPA
jgi:hypothetical protein